MNNTLTPLSGLISQPALDPIASTHNDAAPSIVEWFSTLDIQTQLPIHASSIRSLPSTVSLDQRVAMVLEHLDQH